MLLLLTKGQTTPRPAIPQRRYPDPLHRQSPVLPAPPVGDSSGPVPASLPGHPRPRHAFISEGDVEIFHQVPMLFGEFQTAAGMAQGFGGMTQHRMNTCDHPRTTLVMQDRPFCSQS